MKKEDKVWITIVSIFDAALCLGFLANLLGIWKINEDSVYETGKILIFQMCIYIVNMAGLLSLTEYRYPDGSSVLPVSARVDFILNTCLLVLSFVLERVLPNGYDAPLRRMQQEGEMQ